MCLERRNHILLVSDSHGEADVLGKKQEDSRVPGFGCCEVALFARDIGGGRLTPGGLNSQSRGD